MPLFLGLLERMASGWTQVTGKMFQTAKPLLQKQPGGSSENIQVRTRGCHRLYTAIHRKAARNETRKAAQVEELLPHRSYQQFSGMEEDSKEPTSKMQGLARGSASY